MSRIVSVTLVVGLLALCGEVAKGQTVDDQKIQTNTQLVSDQDGLFHAQTVTEVNGVLETLTFPVGSSPSDATGGAVIGTDVGTPRAGPINAIGPFTGTFQEGFEGSFPDGPVVQFDVFGDGSVVRTMTGNLHLIIASSWSFFGIVVPHSGNAFMGSLGDPVEWVLDTPASRFGGYFATNSGTDDAVANFYDENDNLIAGGLVVSAPQATNEWVWSGWETTGPAIKRVEIIGNNPWGGGFIMHDDMEYTEGGGQPAVGACCFGPGDCADDMTAGDCAAAGGVYQGDDTTCADTDCPESIPTLSEWGLIVTGLLVLAVGAVVLTRGRWAAE